MKAEDLHLFEAGLCKDEEEIKLREASLEKALNGRHLTELPFNEMMQLLDKHYKYKLCLDKDGEVIHESVNLKIPQ